MSRTAIAIISFLITSRAIAGELPPTELTFNVRGLSKQDAVVGQKYATCISTPWLPLRDQLPQKTKDCAPLNELMSPQVAAVMAWADHIATGHPGDEISLHVRRR